MHIPESEENLISDIRKLVPEQRDALTRVLNYCKDVVKQRSKLTLKVEQLFLMIHGGAGVGKSRTIKAMSQCAEKILRDKDSNPRKPRVLLLAQTGKAASLIGGITIHSAFKLNFTTGKASDNYRSLNDHDLAEFRHNLSELKLVIIDEISLVSVDMLYQIHRRLCEIKQKDSTKHLFGCVAMVSVGDLLQLKPVQARWIFKTPINHSDVSSGKTPSLERAEY